MPEMNKKKLWLWIFLFAAACMISLSVALIETIHGKAAQAMVLLLSTEILPPILLFWLALMTRSLLKSNHWRHIQ